jgi:hypothetical protein
VPYVLFVGRITRQKGVTHLVDAIRYLPPETQVVLCAGAPDTPEIAAELREKVEQAQKHHHPRIVWIEKMVTKQEAIQLYSNCRVFCCPSVYEPFGIINLEAMACRAPVVASRRAASKRWWWMEKRATWCPSIRTRSPAFRAIRNSLRAILASRHPDAARRSGHGAGALAMRAASAWKRHSAGRRLRTRRSNFTRAVD